MGDQESERDKVIKARFAELGPAKVRRDLDLGRYGEGKAKYARHWLESIEREDEAEDQAEQRRIARSAKNAAWAAAIAAIIAAIAAAISAVIAFSSQPPS